MSRLQLVVEIVGHTMSILTYLGMAIYITVRRPILRRTVRRAAIVYWMIILTSIVFSLANALRMACLASGSVNTELGAVADLLGEYPSVIAQSVLILIIVSLKVIAEKRSGQRRVLAIGAHPDDIEIACGGTLAKMRDAGYTIQGLIMTCGEQGGSSEIRPAEAQEGARFLGLEKVQVLHFADAHLQEHSLDILKVIEATIRAFQPDIILAHSAHDQHQDHQAVHEATLRAGRNQSTLLCYESPSCTKDFNPSLFVDIENYLDVKIESIREHWDQRDKPYMQGERIRGVAWFRGGQAKVRAAEGFEVVRALSASLGEV